MPTDPAVEVLAEGRFLRLVRDGRWEFAQRRGTTGVVTILAITDSGRLLLAQQYRPPVRCECIELPAGLAGDEPGDECEALASAARRELLEETGYIAERMELLARGPASAGLTDETITFFQAIHPRKVAAGGGDANERIIVHEVPVAELRAWLRAREDAGLLIDYKIFAGLWLAGLD